MDRRVMIGSRKKQAEFASMRNGSLELDPAAVSFNGALHDCQP
jgi:hypothetical protein